MRYRDESLFKRVFANFGNPYLIWPLTKVVVRKASIVSFTLSFLNSLVV